MGIKTERIRGKKIICEIDSSTVKLVEYDTSTRKLLVTFKGDVQYEYEEVPHSVFTKFRMAESQGSFFNKEIGKKFGYKKII
mgnify:FL=1|jgi:hypothetical protein|tara:strand:- start:19395 stop:19640 length:246 start_codon:yes stop_codon:yes gene_type:complete